MLLVRALQIEKLGKISSILKELHVQLDERRACYFLGDSC